MSRKFNEQELIRRNKLSKLIKDSKNPFLIKSFIRTHNSNTFIEEFDKISKESLQEQFQDTVCSIAGRIRSLRKVGKATFANVQDFFGEIQVYIRQDIVGEETYQDVKDYDLGDIIGVYGTPMKTKTNQTTLKVSKVKLLSKSLKVLPDKHSGLTNIEDKYRNRHLDLIVSPSTKKTFVLRHKIIRAIQKYLDNNGYIEVETPILQKIHGGAEARPFKTHHNALHEDLYLRIATELHLKKLVVGSFEKVYEIGRIFRNEGIDTTHNPEFTSIEIYTAYDDMEATMVLCENIFRNSVQAALQTLKFTSRNYQLDFSKDFTRLHIIDGILKYAKIDFWKPMSFEEAKKLCLDRKLEILKHFNSVGHIINLFFEEYVEKHLINPTFIYGYPIEVSPLAKANNKDPRFTDRFELFIAKQEFANAFAELNNPIEQYERFNRQLQEKKAGNIEAHELNIDFIEALEYGLPPTGGIGIGIDRLVMLITDNWSIRNVLLFPTLKNKTTSK